MCRLQVVRDGAFRRDRGLREAIRAVVAASFVFEPARLDEEFDRCDTLYLMRGAGLPNDTYFPDLWGLYNTGQEGGTTGADIKALDAWSRGENGEAVRQRAAEAYHKYQKCGLSAARRLFVTGW